MEAKAISASCQSFLMQMAFIPVALHTQLQAAEVAAKTQAKAAADATIAHHGNLLDAIQLLVDEEFDFPDGYV